MNEGRTPSGIVLLFVVGFIVLVLGFFLFPSVHAQINAVDTTGWNVLAAGVKSLLPYAFIGGIFLAIIWAWARSRG